MLVANNRSASQIMPETRPAEAGSGKLAHPLAEPRAAAALGLAGICGFGWGLLSAQLIVGGLALSVIGALATVWLYANDLRLAVKELRRGNPTFPMPKELWIALAILALEIMVPIYL
jgi:hypothetical protein